MKNNIIAILILILMGSCTKELDFDRPEAQDCASEQIIFDDELFEESSPSDFTILSLTIVEDCLVILYSANSCEEAANWEDSVVGKNTNSDFPYFILGLNLETNTNCDNIYAKELYVDLLPLRIQGENSIHLQMKEYAAGIIYNYNN